MAFHGFLVLASYDLYFLVIHDYDLGCDDLDLQRLMGLLLVLILGHLLGLILGLTLGFAGLSFFWKLLV